MCVRTALLANTFSASTSVRPSAPSTTRSMNVGSLSITCWVAGGRLGSTLRAACSISWRFGSSQSSTARDALLELGRDLGHRRQHGEALLRLAQLGRGVAQAAHDRRLLEERVEVAQHEQRAALAAHHVIDRLHRILHVARALPVRDHLEALGDRPHLEAHLALDTQLAQRLLDALLLGRGHPDQRVARADQILDLRLAAALVLDRHDRSFGLREVAQAAQRALGRLGVVDERLDRVADRLHRLGVGPAGSAARPGRAPCCCASPTGCR